MTELLTLARLGLADTIEELGTTSMHLREAIGFAQSSNMPLALASVDESLDAIDRALAEIHKLRDQAGRWAASAAT